MNNRCRGGGEGYRLTMFAKGFHMKLDSFFNELPRLLDCITAGNTAGKIGQVC
jgi:hypothetical protein